MQVQDGHANAPSPLADLFPPPKLAIATKTVQIHKSAHLWFIIAYFTLFVNPQNFSGKGLPNSMKYVIMILCAIIKQCAQTVKMQKAAGAGRSHKRPAPSVLRSSLHPVGTNSDRKKVLL